MSLTQRQTEVLDHIETHVINHGYPPTFREIGKHFGIRSTNGVADHLKALERKGYLKSSRGRVRAIALVNRPMSVSTRAVLDLMSTAQTELETSRVALVEAGRRYAEAAAELGERIGNVGRLLEQTEEAFSELRGAP